MRYFLGALLGLLFGVVLTGGCAPRTARNVEPSQRVAGSEERMGTTMTVNVNADSISVTPASVDTSECTIRIVNTTDRTQRFTMEGGRSVSLRPNQAAVFRVKRTAPGQYTVSQEHERES